MSTVARSADFRCQLVAWQHCETFLPFAAGASSLVSLARHLEERAETGLSLQVTTNVCNWIETNTLCQFFAPHDCLEVSMLGGTCSDASEKGPSLNLVIGVLVIAFAPRGTFVLQQRVTLSTR